SSPRVDVRTRVLKDGETFAVFDRYGDLQPVGLGEQGLYHDGTRFLSRLELRVFGRRPLLLSSTVKDDNILLTVDLANPDFACEGLDGVTRRTHIECGPDRVALSTDAVRFEPRLAPGDEVSFYLTVRCGTDAASPLSYEEAFREASAKPRCVPIYGREVAT